MPHTYLLEGLFTWGSIFTPVGNQKANCPLHNNCIKWVICPQWKIVPGVTGKTHVS